DHVDQVILPAMERGTTVVCDRFFDSTMAYQGCGQQVDRKFIRSLIKLLGVRPDITVILDLPPNAGFARVAARGLPHGVPEAAAAVQEPTGAGSTAAEPDRYEALGEGFFERVRAGFRAIAEAEPERCVLIDAGRPIEVVQAAIRDALGQRLGFAP
ncbi:MAG: dTMP kinase, partial [Acetobacteraceae bacterium]